MTTTALVAAMAVIAALVSAAGVIAVGLLGRTTAKDSQSEQTMADTINALKTLLDETRKHHEDRLSAVEKDVAHLTGQNGKQADQITNLQDENDRHTKRIGLLERALAAARQYVSDLIALLKVHNIDAPDPPGDYTPD